MFKYIQTLFYSASEYNTLDKFIQKYIDVVPELLK